jgi:hypothetical protein
VVIADIAHPALGNVIELQRDELGLALPINLGPQLFFYLLGGVECFALALAFSRSRKLMTGDPDVRVVERRLFVL